jgi:hypothetical protein
MPPGCPNEVARRDHGLDLAGEPVGGAGSHAARYGVGGEASAAQWMTTISRKPI